MKSSQTILLNDEKEVEVSYWYDKTMGYYEEPLNIASFVEPTVETELLSVMDEEKDILTTLSEEERNIIINQLNYE